MICSKRQASKAPGGCATYRGPTAALVDDIAGGRLREVGSWVGPDRDGLDDMACVDVGTKDKDVMRWLSVFRGFTEKTEVQHFPTQWPIEWKGKPFR